MCKVLPLLLLSACLVVAPACGDDDPAPAEEAPEKPAAKETPKAEPAPEPKTEPKTEPRPDGALVRFRKRMAKLLEICVSGTDDEATADVRDLLLPDAEQWFRTTFGNEHVKALIAEYGPWEKRIAQLPFEILQQLKAGLTELRTERYDDADDEMATAFQAIALRKMKTPMPLYSLRLVEPGKEDGWHVWSFVWHEGRVRFVGRLMGLTPIAADPDLAERGSWRKKVERAERTGK